MKAIHKYKRLYLKYMLALLCISVAFTADCQGLYDLSFRDLDSKTIHLKDFAGKKLLFIILPGSTTDSLPARLKIFVATYGDKVQVIGVLSQEDGYSPDSKAAIKTRYQNSGILVTEAMVSRKGNGQSPLMKWLTNKSENGRFDIDAKGPGQKFFVNEQGRLYAVFGRLSLSSPFIDKVVNAKADNRQQAVPDKETIKP
jgi:glutathione peroxidase